MDEKARLLIATQNRGKWAEIRQILSDLPFRFLSLKDFPAINAVEETGKTFMDNAVLKANGYASQTRTLTLADDSGLEVDALEGKPGVFSARYAGERASDEERVKRLLDDLASVDALGRTARFVSAIAVANPEGKILKLSIGSCEGAISFSPHGEGGFGYDPIFIPLGYDLSFAELGSEIKNDISHRARALAETRDYLAGLTHRSAAD